MVHTINSMRDSDTSNVHFTKSSLLIHQSHELVSKKKTVKETVKDLKAEWER